MAAASHGPPATEEDLQYPFERWTGQFRVQSCPAPLVELPYRADDVVRGLERIFVAKELPDVIGNQAQILVFLRLIGRTFAVDADANIVDADDLLRLQQSPASPPAVRSTMLRRWRSAALRVVTHTS